MIRIESIPNASRTFEALRSLGYDLNSSIADVVDNAITSKVRASQVIINIDLTSKSELTIKIQDNGCGMSSKELKEAMRIGAETTYNEKDLGKFGMGMKTASLSHCNILTVISQKNNSEICGYRWDIKHIRNNGWQLLQLTNSEIYNELQNENIALNRSGTVVIWKEMFWLNEQIKSYESEKLKNNFIYRLKEDIKLHLGMIYHRFLEGTATNKEKIKIIVNNENVNPWDPFYRAEKQTQEVPLKESISTLKIPPYKKAIKINAFVLPTKESFSSEQEWKKAKGLLSWNDSQGYYIYRSDRIIRFGGWHGTKAKDEHDKLARISIDIDSSLDELFRITVNKAKIQFPELLFQHLKNTVNPIITKKAKAIYNNSEESKLFNNKFRKKENKLSLISKKLISEHNIKTTSQTYSSSIEVHNPSGSWLSNKIQDFLKYGSDKDFEIVSDNLSEDSFWKIICDNKSKFKIIINKKHPFYEKIYTTTSNKAVTNAIDALIFSLAFAELYNRNQENAELFETYKSVCSQALKTLIKNEII